MSVGRKKSNFNFLQTGRNMVTFLNPVDYGTGNSVGNPDPDSKIATNVKLNYTFRHRHQHDADPQH